MFTPQTFPLALLMMIISAICWGSWANTYKGVKNYRFELFYWDYAIGIFLMALILGHTMGATSNDPSNIVNNIHSASTSNVVYALIGGAILTLPTCCWSPPSTWPDLPSRFPSPSVSRWSSEQC